MPVLFSRHDPPNMDRVRRPSLNSKCWRYGTIGSCPMDTASVGRLGLTKSGRFSMDGALRHPGRMRMRRPVFPIAANRWTGNGTYSARPVEKLRSGGNRRVEMRSLARGCKPT